ncbi:MAG TPA: cation-translocating P-type ATPase [Puia sp.]|nr:cation-translocating P-type ATPase [Puia sp.]
METETVNWKVEGMSCMACAQTVQGFLQKKGMEDVKVSLTSGEVSFQNASALPETELKKGIANLGYHVAEKGGKARPVNRFLIYLAICVPFTLALMLHMLSMHGPLHWLMNPWVQLGLCLPVYITGMYYFGRSAISSLARRMPNMNVLIALGATAAFVYSLIGTLFGLGEAYLFYETAAAIITLIFFGNYLEERSLQSTQRALQHLVKSQAVTANMIAFDDQHQEMIFPVDSQQLHSGDLILIKNGEQVPADAKVLWGTATVDESILTGESEPVVKQGKDQLIGGSLLLEGTLKAQVVKAARDSVLANVVNLVKRAQDDKPKIQLLADRISAVFVPVVVVIALICFLVNWIVLHDLTASLLRSIAVLVIACPCALGLATPAAVSVGLGRAARNGILFRHADNLELFKNIRQIVFDKTGTLTTGSFNISRLAVTDPTLDETEFKRILFSLEKYSNHPIARSITTAWKTKPEVRWAGVEEIKGFGIKATDSEGIEYKAGSAKFFTGDLPPGHHVYLSRNGKVLGWVDIEDELRPEALETVRYFKSLGIRTMMLSGDRKEKCVEIAAKLGLDEVMAEQTPEQKLAQIERLSAATPTAMVGDGINDAPALAKASLGISLSDASQIAVQTADVVLMNSGLKKLPLAFQLGRATFQTIRQNLFWAFVYNVVAIPIAAVGMLTPALGALAMAFSDIVLLINSARLFVRRLK